MAYHQLTLHDRQHELRVFKSRAIFAAIVCLLVVGILVSRLMYLQVVGHEVFSTLSQNNRLRLKSLAPIRGLIYDRRGRILAENVASYRLEITREEVVDLEATLQALRGVVSLSDDEVARFRRALKRKRKFEEVPLKFNLDDNEVAVFAVNRHRFPGVDIAARLTRHYPYGASTAHVLGYMGRIDEQDLLSLDETNYRNTSHIGKLGVERAYEAELHGQVGFKQVEVNVQGRELRELEKQAPVPGKNIYLHLDIDLQIAAEDALGDNAGAVVAIDPQTGGVLAFVSKPSYDPGLFIHGISTQDYQALSTAEDKPLINRALSGQYPPGSTVKPMIGLAGLEYGQATMNDTVHCKGFYRLPNDNHRYRDWKKQGHGKVGVQAAIVESCDVFFYDLAYRMGIVKMSGFLKHFGLGERTGIDIAGEKTGILPTPEWKSKRLKMPWYPGETLIAGIGQGYMLATPLQLAHATAALAVGKRYQPQLTAALQEAGQAPEQISPELLGVLPVKNAEHWQQIKIAMRDVLHGEKGTAKASARGADYIYAGKTGTAQVISISQDEEYDEDKIAKKHRDHALFIAYAPFEAPKIAIGIIVENGGSGSSAAAPVARKVFDRFLKGKS